MRLKYGNMRSKGPRSLSCLTSLFLLLLFLSACAPTTVAIKEALPEPKIIEQPRPRPAPPDDVMVRKWEDYMDKTNYNNLSVDLVLRSTEEYLAAKDVQFKFLMEAYEKDLILFNNGRLPAAPNPPEQDYSKLIAHFSELVKLFSYDKNADALYYTLGYALSEQGEVDEAVLLFEELLKNYPESQYSLEVYFRLGEFYFETGETAEAMAAYQKIMPHPASPFYEKVIYKLGWVYYKANDYEKALDYFMEIVDMNWEGNPKADALTEEGLSGIVMTLARYSTPHLALKHFQGRGKREYMPLVLKRLGELLADQTRFADAIIVLTYYTELFPERPELAFILNDLADLYERTGDEKSEITTRLKMAYLTNPTTRWYRKNHPNGSGPLDEMLKETMLDLFRKLHLVGKKPGGERELGQAIEGYSLLLQSYPKAEEYKEVKLHLAQALWDAKSYAGAAKEFSDSAALFAQGEERGKIAYSAFLSYEFLFYENTEDKALVSKEAGELLDRYRQDMAAHGALERAVYKMADMHSDIKDYDAARQRLKELLKGRDASKAGKKIAETYIAEGRMEDAEGVYKDIPDSDPEAKEKLLAVRYRIAEDHLKAGRFEKAARKFDETFSTNPASSVAEVSLLQIGKIHMQTGDTDALEGAVRRIIKTYPQSKTSASFLIEAARSLEKTFPTRAAAIYESASTVLGASEDSAKLVFLASQLYEKASEYEKAAESLKKYLSTAPLPEAMDIEARYRLGVVQIRLGRRDDGHQTLRMLVQEKEAVKNLHVARARLTLLEERLDSFLKLKLSQPFEETIKKKADMLGSLVKDYSQVLAYKMPEVYPEVFSPMGLALENFKDSILSSERPHDLDDEELEEYNFLLEEKAIQYDEQAMAAYGNCFRSGVKLMIRNEWVERCFERLKTLKPAIYKRAFVEQNLEPQFLYPDPAYPPIAKGDAR